MYRAIAVMLSLFALGNLSQGLAAAPKARIAVAANFHLTLQAISEQFEASRQDGAKLVLIPGSSGKLFSQIEHGAPFDAFFSADQSRPARLIAAGIGVPSSLHTYAVGTLALWFPEDDPQPLALIARSTTPLSFAIANPKTAPYGRASKEVLDGCDFLVAPQLITASNIAQSFTFTRSGSVDAGFVALSHLIQANVAPDNYLIIDSQQHEPILQDAVALNDSALILDFFIFCQSDDVQAFIRSQGYQNFQPQREAKQP